MTKQDHSQDDGEDINGGHTIDVEESEEKKRKIAKYLASHHGVGMSSDGIACELDGIEVSDVGTYTPDIVSLDFYAIRSKYKNGITYYYAEFEWAKAAMIITLVLSAVGLALGYHFDLLVNCGGAYDV